MRSGFINSNPDLSVWDALPKVVSDYPNCIAKRQSFEEKPRALAHAVMSSTGEVASDIAECFGKWGSLPGESPRSLFQKRCPTTVAQPLSYCMPLASKN